MDPEYQKFQQQDQPEEEGNEFNEAEFKNLREEFIRQRDLLSKKIIGQQKNQKKNHKIRGIVLSNILQEDKNLIIQCNILRKNNMEIKNRINISKYYSGELTKQIVELKEFENL